MKTITVAATIGLLAASASMASPNEYFGTPYSFAPMSKKYSGKPTAGNGMCCKVCTKGKACGNSCISRRLVCHKPPGCACDGK